MQEPHLITFISPQILVLDEADRMLEDNFGDQMNEIMNQCSKTRQTMLFSATMSTQVKELALVSLKNPVKVSFSVSFFPSLPFLTLSSSMYMYFIELSRNYNILKEQTFFQVFINQNTDVARNLKQEFIRIRASEEKYRESVLVYLVSRYFQANTLIFCQTKVKKRRIFIQCQTKVIG